MKKDRISFRVIGDSGPLAISWSTELKGPAVEANNQIGVGFFAHNGDLLSVEFDDVEEKKDHQVLEFDRYRVEVDVNKGKVSYVLTNISAPKKIVRSSRKRDKDAA